MPSAIRDYEARSKSGITKFTNCLLVKGDDLVNEDLWISSVTGKILHSQEVFYDQQLIPDEIIDLGGRIISPGFIDVQLNGAYGFDFSVIPEEGMSAYGKGVRRVNKSLIKTGVTSYLPTITSQTPEVYHKVLPFLAPSGASRDPTAGSESLGAHCEGPFINPTKSGIHDPSILLTCPRGLPDLIDCYGASNLTPPCPIRLITLAPELPGALQATTALTALGIVVSIGHSDASYEEARAGIAAGATMITHLFNAMRPLHHRNPGIFGLLGTASPSSPRSTPTSTPTSTPGTPGTPGTPTTTTSTPSTPQKPFFGLIADGTHLHPTSTTLAHAAHPRGCILVTDAMSPAGLPNGTYPWHHGARITKHDALLTLDRSGGRIAGSSATLVACVDNFWNWTGVAVAVALRAVTEAPARMAGVWARKGRLGCAADADLCVLRVEEGGGFL
ncbi:carbohydrate esterase family 9 protein [Glonium stellatum]|uniref:Carbohydrate esterase family 9 protein n=1 Tax=Glonium stellatum TaxID=574774 RepID=A0A8E2JM47_9PEZI|nr:carbohydrate esterase family 9 protein [Glonium stellatum]